MLDVFLLSIDLNGRVRSNQTESNKKNFRQARGEQWLSRELLIATDWTSLPGLGSVPTRDDGGRSGPGGIFAWSPDFIQFNFPLLTFLSQLELDDAIQLHFGKTFTLKNPFVTL